VQSNKSATILAIDTGKTELCYNSCDLANLFSIYGDEKVNVGDTILYSYFVQGFKNKADVIISVALTSNLSKSSPRYLGEMIMVINDWNRVKHGLISVHIPLPQLNP
jgi:hypothetical protein